jgi:hypothetical protein
VRTRIARRLIIPSRSPVHFVPTLALAASSKSDEVSLPGELDGLSAGGGLPALAEALASSVWGFGGDVAGSFVQATARRNSMILKEASKFWNRGVFIVVSSLPVIRTFGAIALGTKLCLCLSQFICSSRQESESRIQESESRSEESESRSQESESRRPLAQTTAFILNSES